MGTSLTGKNISSTYLGLLKTTDNAVIGSTAKRLTDGSGTDSPLYLSTSKLGIGVTPTEALTISSGNIQLSNDNKIQFGTSDVYISGTTSTDNIQLGIQGATKLTLHQTTGLTLAQYGGGTITGTVTQRLGVTSAGQVVEIPIGGGAVDGSGTAGKITKWTDSDTIGDSLLTETTDAVKLADNKEFILGNDSDLTIKHSSTGNQNSIKSDTHQLFITSDVGIELADNAGKSFFEATAGGSSRLFYNNSKKIETTNTGVEITGDGTFTGIVGINGSTTTNVPLTATTSSGYEDVAYFKSAGTNIKARINLIPTGTGDGVVNATANDLVLQTGGADRVTITDTSATFAGNVTIDNSSPEFYLTPDSAKYSWMIAAQENVDQHFEITPSTTVGGTTFNAPALKIDGATSNATFAGNVGIGTSPANLFSVSASGTVTTRYTSSDTGAFSLLQFENSGSIVFSADHGNTQSNSDIIFKSDGASERMRITSGGDVLVGKTGVTFSTAGTAIFEEGEIDVATDGGISLALNRLSSDGDTARFFRQTSQVGSISVTSSATAYNTSSDYRLKEDLKDFNALDIASKIKMYDFKWKADDSRSYGVMAHELEEVLPQAVTGKKDAEEMQQVDYSKLVPILLKSIQELESRVQELEKEI